MMELICPAGTPAALRSAIEAGADAVYCGFNDETNARNFPGLNFSRDELRKGIALAHRSGAKVLVAINTFPRASSVELWHRAVDDAVDAGADALILADIGLMDYTARCHPSQRLLRQERRLGTGQPSHVQAFVTRHLCPPTSPAARAWRNRESHRQPAPPPPGPARRGPGRSPSWPR